MNDTIRPSSDSFTGLIDDPRSDAEKRLDWLHEERTPQAAATDPFGNTKLTDTKFPVENQWQTSSCVPHGVGLALAIERKLDTNLYARLAQLFAYRLRSNYAQAGCWLQDIFAQYRTYGAPLFTTSPTRPGETEQEANALILTTKLYQEAEIYRGGAYFQLETPNDIDEVATIASRGHGVPILIYATYDEWSKEMPTLDIPNLAQQDPRAVVKHCVSVHPNSGFTEHGKRYVSIQDSAWFGGLHFRHLSEDFIAARVFGAGYWDTVQLLGSANYPKHRFTRVLTYGMNNSEVAWMQRLFIAEGFLPNDCATGYFGGMTLGALHAFQNKYADEILVPIGLDAPTDVFGSMSIAKANRLCV